MQYFLEKTLLKFYSQPFQELMAHHKRAYQPTECSKDLNFHRFLASACNLDKMLRYEDRNVFFSLCGGICQWKCKKGTCMRMCSQVVCFVASNQSFTWSWDISHLRDVHFKNWLVSNKSVILHCCSLKLNNRERILNVNASYSTLITYVMVCKDTFKQKREQEHGDCSRGKLFYYLFPDKKSWPIYPNTNAISKQHLFTFSI